MAARAAGGVKPDPAAVLAKTHTIQSINRGRLRSIGSIRSIKVQAKAQASSNAPNKRGREGRREDKARRAGLLIAHSRPLSLFPTVVMRFSGMHSSLPSLVHTPTSGSVGSDACVKRLGHALEGPAHPGRNRYRFGRDRKGMQVLGSSYFIPDVLRASKCGVWPWEARSPPVSSMTVKGDVRSAVPL